MTETYTKNAGFSLVELTLAMTITMVILGLTMTLFTSALGTRTRESRRTDALTSARAALNVISREIANSGYGMDINGIVTGDSNGKRIHFRSNINNNNQCTTDNGEDVTYFFDETTKSIVRHIRYSNVPCSTSASDYITETSVVVNKISRVDFAYYDYSSTSTSGTLTTTPTNQTGRVEISVEVALEDVKGQPTNQKVNFKSEVTLRNSEYMLNQY